MDKPRRGLGSLIPTGRMATAGGDGKPDGGGIFDQIQTNPYQPRLSLNPEHLQEPGGFNPGAWGHSTITCPPSRRWL